MTKKEKILKRFKILAHHRARVEIALLDCMVDLYESEKKAEEVAAIPDYKIFVLKDLENAVRTAYEKYEAVRAQERPCGKR